MGGLNMVHKKSSPIESHKHHNKNTKFKAEKQRVYNLLSESIKPLTMLQVSKLTGVRIQNVTRYKTELVDEGKIFVAYLGRCEISKYDNVQFLTIENK